MGRERPRAGGWFGGALTALVLLVAVSLAARASRAETTGDGVWNAPVLVVAGMLSLVLLVVTVLWLRHMDGGALGAPTAPRGTTRSTLALFLVTVALVVLFRPEPTPPPEPVEDVVTGAATAAGEPADRTASPTAVAAGLAGLALLAAAGAALATGAARRRPDLPAAATDEPPAATATATAAPTLPEGPPEAVVLAAYALGRAEVVRLLGHGDHDPPGRLLDRAAGTPMGEPLRVLTAAYLPVRFGRRTATPAQAAAAVEALGRLRRQAGARR